MKTNRVKSPDGALRDALATRRPFSNPNGRPKGVPNKVPGHVRDLLRQALEEAGGKDWFLSLLTSKISSERTAALQAITKLIPSELTGETGAPIQVIVRSLANDVAANPATCDPSPDAE